jgi:hypothetical protein
MIYPNKFRGMELMDRYLQGVCCAGLALSLMFLFVSVYHLFAREKFTKTPAALMQSVQLAAIKIKQEHASLGESDRCDEFAQGSIPPLSDEPYQTGIWCPPLWTYRLRSSPHLYPVQTLWASSGHGAFSVISRENHPRHGDGDHASVRKTNTEGCRWVVVTGIIEHHKQIQAYEDAFRGTKYHNPAIDYPDYQSFQVERAEVLGNCTEGKLHWEEQPVQAMYDVKHKWPRVGEDIVDAKYFPPSRDRFGFVFPLGPLENDVWRAEVGHPRITRYESALQNKDLLRPVPIANGDEIDFGNPVKTIPLPRQRNGSFPRHVAAPLASSEKPDILFMRYVDYDVQPGKQYSYRIKLILHNPNYQVPKKFLEEADFDQIQNLEAAWSEPSPAVAVPVETTVELLAVNSARRCAVVRLKHFDLQTGGYQTNDFTVERGQVMNFYRQEYYPPADPSAPKESDISLTGPSPRVTVAPQRVDYVTDMVLMDCREGHRLPGRNRVALAEPSSILLLDSEGNLLVVKEKESALRAQFKQPDNKVASAPKRKPAD